jgi:uncharacterized protein involved in exopolysaccharide biosynthesis
MVIMSSHAADNWRDRDVLDFHALLLRIWAGRWWIVASSFLLASVALVAGFLMTPVYRATAVLIPASADHASLGNSLGSLGGLAALAGVNLGGSDSATQEALAFLRSREFGNAFIKDRNLIPQFFDDKWDASDGKWKVPPEDQPTAADAFRYFDLNVRTVMEDKKTGLISLHINWRDREAAAVWANDLVARLNAEMQRRAIERADASVGFLKKELEATTVVDTRNAINRLIETQVNQRMLANVTAEYAFRVVDRALTPDKHEKVRPRKFLMLVTGGFLGFLAGVVSVLMFRRVNQ